jgi:hypothetical protein
MLPLILKNALRLVQRDSFKTDGGACFGSRPPLHADVFNGLLIYCREMQHDMRIAAKIARKSRPTR